MFDEVLLCLLNNTSSQAASQTIESSGEDFDVDLPLTEEAVCNMPYISSPARESSDVTEVKKQQQGEETQTEEKKDMESIFETNSPKPEGSSLPIPIPSTNLVSCDSSINCSLIFFA